MARFARAVLAGVTLVALVIGLPILLARYGSWPIHQVPTASQLSDAPSQALTDDAVFAILTVAAWATWATFTVSVALELVAALRGASRPTLPYLGPIQHGARQLVASFLMTATLTGPFASHRVVAAPALPPLSDLARQPVAAVIHEEPPPQAPADEPPVDPAMPIEDLPVVRVARGDSPWSLAERHLGDGLRWRELWDLNRGVPQADGRAWVVEDQIDISWQIRLPADAVGIPSPESGDPAGGGGSAASPGEHLVLQGDTLREIADAELGDPERYPEIFEASQSIEQPGGARLTDPDLILPGWTLRLPTAPAPPEPAAPSDPSDTPPPNGSVSSTTTTTGPPPTTAPPSTNTSPARTAPATATADVNEAPPPAAVEAGSDRPAPGEGDEADPEAGSLLSALGTTLAGITGATVLATGLAALIRQRRRRRPGRSTTRRPSDTELAIVRASDVPLVRWAGQSLGAMAARLDPRRLDGVPVAVELSDQTGIELLWDSPQPNPHDPWQVTAGGWAWRLPYDLDAPVPADEYPSPLPALVTVGRRDGRQLLVNLEALGSLAICGDETAARALMQAVVLELTTSEDLADSYLTLAGIEVGPSEGLDRVESTTADEALHQLAVAERSVADLLGDDATTFAVRCGARGTHIEASVFIVDGTIAPGHDGIDEALANGLPHHGTALIVLGDLPGAAARLTVSSDGSAHLAPMGLDFEASGLPPETSDLLRHLLEAEAEDDVAGKASDADSDADSPGSADAGATAETKPTIFDPADLQEVALLGQAVIDLRVVDHPLDKAVPAAAESQINGNGLASAMTGVAGDHHDHEDADDGELPVTRPRLLVKVLGRPHVPDRPDLGRRETVLAAYLACHDGPATTSGVQDAIWNGRAVESKTLWNLIARTRRALGSFDDGTPVMPQADRIKGTITLGPGAMSDLTLLRTSYERAVESSSAEAIPLLSKALDLIEGPPFDAPGYDWAHHVHQYVAEASALIEQAAELLAKLAQADGDTDLARHALVQGLRALPGNEVLYRQRMQLEHDTGNLAGVKAAYAELMAILAEFEAEPTANTDSAYVRLTQPLAHGSK